MKKSIVVFLVTFVSAALCSSCKKEVSDSYEFIVENKSGHEVVVRQTQNPGYYSPIIDYLLPYRDENGMYLSLKKDFPIHYGGGYSGDVFDLPDELNVIFDGKYSIVHKTSDGAASYNNICSYDSYSVQESDYGGGETHYTYTFTFSKDDYDYAVSNGVVLE